MLVASLQMFGKPWNRPLQVLIPRDSISNAIFRHGLRVLRQGGHLAEGVNLEHFHSSTNPLMSALHKPFVFFTAVGCRFRLE